MSEDYRPEARTDDLVLQEAETDLLIYDLNNNRASCLNSTAAEIWKSCDGTRTVSEIARDISAASGHHVRPEMVSLGIHELLKNRLLQHSRSKDTGPDHVSRRELIKKIGLSSAIAIPVVASLIAPTAVHANSACVSGGSCICSEISMGMAGQICTVTVNNCTDFMNCQCAWANDGNAMGICVP